MMMRILWAELMRLRRPAFLATICFVPLLSVLFVTVFLEAASRNLSIAQEELDFLNTGPTAEVCEYVYNGTPRSCEEALRERRSVSQAWILELRRNYVLRGAIGDPLGAGGIAAGFIASTPGALMLAALAGAHIAGEWSEGTAAPRFARDGRRSAFVLGKFFSLVAAALLALGLVWAALLVAGPVLVRATSMPPPEVGFEPQAYLISQLPRSIIVIAFFSAVATAIAVAARRPLLTLVVMAGVLVVASASALSRGAAWAPASWVASVMGFRPSGMLADHVWADRGQSTDWRVASIALSLATALLVLVAMASLRRDPLDR